jgi:hypothetical protein
MRLPSALWNLTHHTVDAAMMVGDEHLWFEVTGYGNDAFWRW